MGRPKKTQVAPEIITPVEEVILHDENSQNEMLLNMALGQGEFIAPEEVKNDDNTEGSTTENEPNNKGTEAIDDNEINEAFNALLDPSIVIAVVDSVIVVLFKLVAKAMSLNVDSDDIALSDDERAMLRPVVKRYLMTLGLKLSPLSALLISVGMIYATKIPAIIVAAKGGNTEFTPKVSKPTRARKKATRGPYKKKINIKVGG